MPSFRYSELNRDLDRGFHRKPLSTNEKQLVTVDRDEPSCFKSGRLDAVRTFYRRSCEISRGNGHDPDHVETDITAVRRDYATASCAASSRKSDAVRIALRPDLPDGHFPPAANRQARTIRGEGKARI